MDQDKRITDEKLVLQAAESVWAMNKYFILACSQQDYREVRKLLRRESQDLQAAYHVFKNAEDTFQDVATEDLPEVSNALYHMAGYFKKFTSREDRQAMDTLIQSNPRKALGRIEVNARQFKVDYLLESRIWSSERMQPFNLVPISLNDNNTIYQANELLWQGNYLTPR